MSLDRPRKTPGPDHEITIEPSAAHVVVRHGSAVVAETDRALELCEAAHEPVLYVPLADVDRAMLRDSDRHTYCPYKGEASYFDIVDGGGADLEGAVWYYPEPYPAVGEIKDHVAFYTDRVSVTAEP